jgi:hypothetical protein
VTVVVLLVTERGKETTFKSSVLSTAWNVGIGDKGRGGREGGGKKVIKSIPPYKSPDGLSVLSSWDQTAQLSKVEPIGRHEKSVTNYQWMLRNIPRGANTSFTLW